MTSLVAGFIELVKYTNVEIYRWTVDKILSIIDKIIDSLVLFMKS